MKEEAIKWPRQVLVFDTGFSGPQKWRAIPFKRGDTLIEGIERIYVLAPERKKRKKR